LKINNLNKVIIPIAGLGTRMLPATKAIPKEMLPIVNKPIIQYVVEEIIESGFKEIIFITHSSKSSVENHFDQSFELETVLKKRVKRRLLEEIKSISNLKISIQTIRQGQALGLGHAILCAKPIVQKEPFAVVLPDMLIKKINEKNDLLELKKEFETSGKSQILLGKIQKKDVSSYGIVKIQNKLIQSIVEKPSLKKAPSNLFVIGRYIFENDFFKYLKNNKTSKSGEYELTSAIQNYINDNNEIYSRKLSGNYYDCGNKLGYLKAIVDYALEDEEHGKEFKKYLKNNYS
tara:strand:+ start:116 stop:985 length:870 start_codon:yes stop_codon:yes gene_type:complete